MNYVIIHGTAEVLLYIALSLKHLGGCWEYRWSNKWVTHSELPKLILDSSQSLQAAQFPFNKFQKYKQQTKKLLTKTWDVNKTK